MRGSPINNSDLRNVAQFTFAHNPLVRLVDTFRRGPSISLILRASRTPSMREPGAILRRWPVMSALPSKVDIRQHNCDVCFVPQADSCGAAKKAIRSPGLQVREDWPEW
jgi:hypothetical protein